MIPNIYAPSIYVYTNVTRYKNQVDPNTGMESCSCVCIHRARRTEERGRVEDSLKFTEWPNCPSGPKYFQLGDDTVGFGHDSTLCSFPRKTLCVHLHCSPNPFMPMDPGGFHNGLIINSVNCPTLQSFKC